MAKNKKIWIADDDESIRFVLESGLSEAGFNVSTFEDGNEVVNKLDIESPHLLLTDLKCPEEMAWIYWKLFVMSIKRYQ